MTESIHVLLIDDDKTARQGLARYLRDVAEFEVKEFSDGEKALQHLKTNPDEFSVVLLDFVLKTSMPGKRIFELLKEQFSHLPVIVFSGINRDGAARTLSKGSDYFMPRPINHTELVNVIQNLAEQDRLFTGLAQDARQLLGADMCLAWRLNRRERRFEIAGWDQAQGLGLDVDFRRTVFLKIDNPSTQTLLAKKKPLYLRDVTDSQLAPDYQHRDEAKKHGWTSLISIPLVKQEQVIGLLDGYYDIAYTFGDGDRERWLKDILPAFAKQAAEAIRNGQLSEQFQAIQAINQLLSGAYNKDTIVKTILAKGLELVDADAGWVYLVDSQAGVLTLSAYSGISANQVDQKRKFGQGLTGRVAEEGQVINVSNRDQATKEGHIATPGIEVNSQLTVPLRREDHTIGVMAVKSRTPDSFTNDHEDLLNALASQAAVAVERTSLTKHLQKISQLALERDFEKLANYVVTAASDLTGAEVILWMERGKQKEQEKTFRIFASQGDFNPDYIETAAFPIGPNESITGSALQKKEPIYRADIQNDSEKPPFHNMKIAEKRGWHSFMVVPFLDNEGQPLGSLSLYSKEINKFGPPDAELMWAFANQAAFAFEDVQQQKQLERLADGHQALNDIGAELMGLLDENEILDSVARLVTEVIDCAHCSIFRLEANELVVEVTHGQYAQAVKLQPERTFKIGQGVAGWVAKKGEPALVPNTLKDKRFDPGWSGDENPLSLLVVPVVLEKKQDVYGVISVEHDQMAAFDDHDLQLLEIFARQASTAIKNTQLIKQLEELNTISRYLSAQTNLESIYETAVKGIRKTLDCTHVTFFVLNEDTLHPLKWAPKGSEIQRTRCFKLGEGLAGRAAQRVESSLIRYPAMSKIFVEGEQTKGMDRSLINVPVIVKKEVMGVISVDQDRKNAFNESDLQMVETVALQVAIAIEKARLFEQIRRQQETQVQALEEISASIAVSLDLDEVLDHILDWSLDLMGEASLGEIRLYDEEGDELVAKAFKGENVALEYNRIPLGEGITGYAAQQKETIYVPDVSKNKYYIQFIGNSKSELAIPMMIGDEKLVGLLNIEHPELDPFDETDIKLAESLASLATVAIENTRLYEQRCEDISSLGDINNAILSQSLEKVAELITIKVAELLKVDYCVLRLVDDAGGKLLPFSGEERRNDSLSIDGTSFTGWVASERKAAFSNDVSKDRYYAKWDEKVKSCMAASLLHGENLIGTIYVDSNQLNAFNDRKLELLQSFADQAAIAIENARLYKQLDDLANRKIEDLRAVNKLGQTLAQLDLTEEQIMELIYILAEPLMHTENMYIALYEQSTDEVIFPLMFVDGKREEVKTRKAGAGRTEHIIRTKKPLLIFTEEESEAWYQEQGRREYIDEPFASWLGVPMLIGDDVLGVIATYHKTDDFVYDQDDQAVLESIASQAAIALQNIRYVDELEAFQELAEDFSAGSFLDAE